MNYILLQSFVNEYLTSNTLQYIDISRWNTLENLRLNVLLTPKGQALRHHFTRETCHCLDTPTPFLNKPQWLPFSSLTGFIWPPLGIQVALPA